MIVVYYCDVNVLMDGSNLIPRVEMFPEGESQLTDMLARCRELHALGKFFITSASHHNEGVVTGVIDGKLPDGTPYTWRKRRP